MARVGYRLLVAAGGIGLIISAVLAFAVPHPLGSVASVVWVAGAVLPTYLLGALALAARPAQLAARWLAAVGSLLALQTAGTRVAPLLDGADVGWLVVAATLLQIVTLATAASMASLFVVFPGTSYEHRAQRRVIQALWALVIAIPLALATSEEYLLFSPLASPGSRVANPLFVPALAPLQPVAATAFRWRAGLWVIGVAIMLLRYARADGATRRTFKWPLVAATLFAGFVVSFRLLEQVDRMPSALRVLLLFGGWVPGMALVALTVLVAVLRHRLIGVDLRLRRSILHGGVSAVIKLAQLGLAAAVGLLAGGRISSAAGVAAALATVVTLQPVRHRLEDHARQWVYGQDVRGSELLRRVGRTLEDAYDGEQLAANLAGTIVDGLRLEWARVLLHTGARDQSEPVATVGIGRHEQAEPDLVVTLTHAGATVGVVECGPKIDGELSKADEELLATVARQAALAVHNIGLAAELEKRLDELSHQAVELAASRERIVAAQIAERRRIERNIHDGVQQEIIASIAKLRLSRNQLTRDPGQAAETLEELQQDTRRMLENLRELSRGIHPLVLTHRGLAAALDTQASHLPIDVRIDAAAEVRAARYAEDVEAAAYYVISEGLTNVIKHAGTTEATICLRATNGHLIAEVTDRGRGWAQATATGSGLVGLRDRVESIGGELHLTSQPNAGTTLRAVLPARVTVGEHA